MSNVLVFSPHRKKRKRMDKKTKNAKSDRDKTPKKITIKIPTYVWVAVVEDAELQRRTLAKQLEMILVEHYRLDAELEASKSALSSGVQWAKMDERQLLNK